jgi:hypothetical protein
MKSYYLLLGLTIFSCCSLPAQDVFGRNLLVNGDAEAGPGTDGHSLPSSIPGWSGSGSPNVITYASEWDLEATGIVPVNAGKNYFAGGPNTPLATLSQTVDFSRGADAIDAGGVTYEVSGYLGGDNDATVQMTVQFLDAAGSTLRSVTLGPVTHDDRYESGLYFRRAIGPLPVGTRRAGVTLRLARLSGTENDGFADSLALVLHAPADPESLLDTNLIFNGDAEAAPASDASTVTPDIPGWVRTANFSVDYYEDGSGDMGPDSPGPDDRGKNYFWGGPSNPAAAAWQDIDVSSAAALIDQGIMSYAFSAWVGGYSSQEDNAVLTAQFMDWTGNILLTSTLGPVPASDRNENSSVLPQADSSTVPPGTRMVRVKMTMTRTDGSDDDGLAENLSLTFSVPE